MHTHFIPGRTFSDVIDGRVGPVLRVRRRQGVLLPPQRPPQPLRHVPLLLPPPAVPAVVEGREEQGDRKGQKMGHRENVTS